jgi:predicted membrane channel-forming protein YqfA (hemolysin III family)
MRRTIPRRPSRTSSSDAIHSVVPAVGALPTHTHFRHPSSWVSSWLQPKGYCRKTRQLPATSPPIYALCGWGAILFLPGFIDGASRLGAGVGRATLILMATGGVLYIVGAVVYGLRRPDPWPHSFGFHEVFHTLTVLAFTSHYTGICLATYSMR